MSDDKSSPSGGAIPTHDHISGLSDHQLEHFDQEYVDDVEWEILRPGLDEQFKGRGTFRFLDVGGGNGRFADRVLDAYPDAHCVVLDNADQLLSKNTPHPRKSLQLASAADLTRLLSGERFDLIFFNLVLHHMVTKQYSATRMLQARILGQGASLLAPGGVISITEDIYEGIASQALPGWLIYQLTSSRLLASLTARLGANTAGVGVCFLSPKQITSDAASAGLKLLRYRPGPLKRVPNLQRAALLVRSTHHGHFLFRSGHVSHDGLDRK